MRVMALMRRNLKLPHISLGNMSKLFFVVFLIIFSILQAYIVASYFFSALSDWSEKPDEAVYYSNIACELGCFSPDFSAGLARAYRNIGISEKIEFNEVFLKSEEYFKLASKYRPDWPYYKLGILDSRIRANKSAKEIRDAFNDLIETSPNERGVDKLLLPLSISVWGRLNKQQRAWVIERIVSAKHWRKKSIIDFANKIGQRPNVCMALPWKVASEYCYSSRRRNNDIRLELQF